MYADHVTDSMKRAMAEVDRRRVIQEAYNKEHNIVPQGITKAIRERMVDEEIEALNDPEKAVLKMSAVDFKDVPPNERKKLVKDLENKMRTAAEELNFELAADLRDQIIDIKKNL